MMKGIVKRVSASSLSNLQKWQMREGLIRGRGGGGYLKSYIFDEIHNNFPNFTITTITKTEQEVCLVSAFYKC